MPSKETATVEGTVEGLITDQPKGDHGFGYDPVFLLPDRGVTMAELPAAIKNEISHRGQAAQKAKQLLLERLARQ